MHTRGCIICRTDKLIEAFNNKSSICNLCIEKSEVKPTTVLSITPPQIATDDNKLSLDIYMELKEASRLYSLSKKDVILILMDILKDDIKGNSTLLEFSRMSQKQINANFKRQEILVILEEFIFEKKQLEQPQTIKTVINIPEILNYYSELKKPIVKKENPRELLRKSAPNYIKNHFPTWKSASIEEIYNITNQHISSVKGELREELLAYSCDLSKEIFEGIPVVPISMSIVEAKESIKYVVESIVLPYLEVMDKIDENEGSILFEPENNQTLSKELIKEVFSRNNEQCVVCTRSSDLQIHYKIPMAFGGTHVIENLVTVCVECKNALETLDLELAVNKCINNYKQLL